MYISDTRLKSFLSDAGLVSQKAFSEAENEAKKHSVPVGDILKAHNVIGEDELRRTYAYILGIPFVSLTGTDIKYETLSLIPEPVARRNNIIAYSHHGNELEVAMLDTDDLAAIDSIKKKTQLKILPRLTDVLSIKHALKLYQKGLKDNLGDVIERETTLLEKGGEMKDEDLHKIASGASAVRIVDTLLRHASAQGASDIHIEPEETSLLIRYRIDGIAADHHVDRLVPSALRRRGEAVEVAPDHLFLEKVNLPLILGLGCVLLEWVLRHGCYSRSVFCSLVDEKSPLPYGRGSDGQKNSMDSTNVST